MAITALSRSFWRYVIRQEVINIGDTGMKSTKEVGLEIEASKELWDYNRQNSGGGNPKK